MFPRGSSLFRQAALVLAAAGMLLTSCEKPGGSLGPLGDKEKKRPLFFISTDQLQTPMRSHQVVLLDRLIHSKAGLDVAIYDAKGDPAAQAAHVENAVKQGAAFLMVFPGDAEKLTPALRAALQKGVKVFAFSDKVPADACTSRVFCDPRGIGRLAGDFIVAALKTKAAGEGRPETTGRVVQLRGEESGGVSELFGTGLKEALAAAPGVVLVHDAPANWNAKEAAERINEAFAVQKNFDVVFAHNDLMASGASQAARARSAETRESMLIVGLDGAPGKGAGMELVNTGVVDATVYNPPLVDVAWGAARQMLEDESFKPKERYVVKPFMIGPDNVPEMLRKVLPDPVVE